MNYAELIIGQVLEKIGARIFTKMPITFDVYESIGANQLFLTLSIDFESVKGLFWCSSVFIKNLGISNVDGIELQNDIDEIELQHELRCLINKEYEVKG